MSELSNAIKQVCEEKNLDYDTVVSTIELALAAACRKDYGEKNQNIKVKFDVNTGKSEIFDVKTVVEDLPEQKRQKCCSAFMALKTKTPKRNRLISSRSLMITAKKYASLILRLISS